jgi:hypothetical protein
MNVLCENVGAKCIKAIKETEEIEGDDLLQERRSGSLFDNRNGVSVLFTPDDRLKDCRLGRVQQSLCP